MTSSVTPPGDVQTFRAEPISHRATGERSRGTAFWALLPALVTAAVVYRQAGTRALWEDEYVTWHAVAMSWSDLGRMLTNVDLVHAFYYVVMRGWVAVAGDSLLTLRIPSLAAMVVTAAAATLIGRRLAGTRVGVVGGLLLALIPSISRYAQEVRSYALVTMLVTVSTWFLLRAVERPTWPRWFSYALTLALAGLGHFLSFAVLGAHLLYALLATRSTDEIRRWRFAGAAAGACLVVIPLPALASRQSGQVSWLADDKRAPVELPARLFLADHLAYAVILLALLGAVLLWRKSRAGTVLLLAWAAVPILFIYASSPVLHLLAARYVLFTLPAFTLLAAGAIVFLFGPYGAKKAGARWMLSAALVLPGLAYLAVDGYREVRTSPVKGQPGYAPAFAYIAAKTQPGDGIVYNDRFRTHLARTAAEYELRAETRTGRAPKDVLLTRTAAQVGRFGAEECPDPAPCLSGNKRLWLLSTGTGKQPWEGMKPAAAAILDHDFSAGEVQQFPRIRVVLLTRKAPGS
ncbi:glycosyltransferase family 39 protein [Actinoplanes sp. NPDC051633]|uniref:glycosyltransferase family 39 protein n=1 Tax=Actinoplanes sp. NPDC051633 TaxID=3155670 RepID=UPI003443727F